MNNSQTDTLRENLKYLLFTLIQQESKKDHFSMLEELILEIDQDLAKVEAKLGP